MNTRLVWAAAAMAFRVNRRFLSGKSVSDMKNAMSGTKGNIKLSDYQLGEEARSHYKAMSKTAVESNLNSYMTSVVACAEAEIIKDPRAMAVVASVIPVFVNETKTTDTSHLGIGEIVRDDVVVTNSIYSEKWKKHYITVKTADNTSMVFASNQRITPNSLIKIEGKINAFEGSVVRLIQTTVFD